MHFITKKPLIRDNIKFDPYQLQLFKKCFSGQMNKLLPPISVILTTKSRYLLIYFFNNFLCCMINIFFCRLRTFFGRYFAGDLRFLYRRDRWLGLRCQSLAKLNIFQKLFWKPCTNDYLTHQVNFIDFQPIYKELHRLHLRSQRLRHCNESCYGIIDPIAIQPNNYENRNFSNYIRIKLLKLIN